MVLLAPTRNMNLCWFIVNWTHRNIPQWHLHQNTFVFRENVLCIQKCPQQNCGNFCQALNFLKVASDFICITLGSLYLWSFSRVYSRCPLQNCDSFGQALNVLKVDLTFTCLLLCALYLWSFSGVYSRCPLQNCENFSQALNVLKVDISFTCLLLSSLYLWSF